MRRARDRQFSIDKTVSLHIGPADRRSDVIEWKERLPRELLTLSLLFSFQMCFDPRMRNSCCIFKSSGTRTVVSRTPKNEVLNFHWKVDLDEEYWSHAFFLALSRRLISISDLFTNLLRNTLLGDIFDCSHHLDDLFQNLRLRVGNGCVNDLFTDPL